MGRIIKTIELHGQPATTLFDTGAVYTYVKSAIVGDALRVPMPRTVHVVLGGQDINITEMCFIDGKIEGLDFLTDVVPVEEPGRADGHELDAVIGARTMEQWEIRLDPRTGELDLEGLRRGELTEF